MPEPAIAVVRHATGGPFIRALGAVDRLIEHLEKAVLGGTVLFLTGMLILHVLGRELLGKGINGQVELTQFSLVIMTFAGLGYGVRRARHIAMSAFYDQLRGWPRKTLLVIICTISGAMMFFLAWHAWVYVSAIESIARTSSALSIPLWIPYLAAPIGFALAGIQYWLTAIRNLTSRRLYRSFTEREGYDEVPDGTEG